MVSRGLSGGALNWAPCMLRDAPLKLLEHYGSVIEGFKGALNWSPFKPRHASLSDSQCDIFQSGLCVESDRADNFHCSMFTDVRKSPIQTTANVIPPSLSNELK